MSLEPASRPGQGGPGGKRGGRRLLFPVLGIVFLPLALGSCGLEKYVYLDAVNKDTVVRTAPLYWDFRHNTLNDKPEFLGYAVYYRIYVSGNSAISAIQNSLSGQLITTESQLTTNGFRRIKGGLGTMPQVPIASADKDDNLIIRLRYAGINDSTPQEPTVEILAADGVTVISAAAVIRRDAGVSSHTESLPATFLRSGILTGDDDVKGINFTNALAVLLCVVAYGINPEDFSASYSSPVFLAFSGETTGSFVIN